MTVYRCRPLQALTIEFWFFCTVQFGAGQVFRFLRCGQVRRQFRYSDVCASDRPAACRVQQTFYRNNQFVATWAAPAFWASRSNVRELCMVCINIGSVAEDLEISRAALIPSMIGIATSRTSRSGFSSSVLTTASNPFTASPQTCQSAWLSIRARKTLRTAEWSSAIRIRKGKTSSRATLLRSLPYTCGIDV